MDIYIAHDGQESGPFSDNAARELLAQGAVKENDFAWRTGMEKWVPLSELLAESKEELPVAGSTPPPPSEGKFEPATPKQKALLSFLGITFAPDLSRDQAARRVNDAMEDSSNTDRLKLWNEERLRLHPELFAAEIQAKKENRANHFLELCQTTGVRYFSGISKAHCQVLVGFLDVKFPNWDAREAEAAENYFYPAVAEKFPQLVHKQWRGRLRYAEGMKVSPELVSKSASTPLRVTATSPVVAVARGVALGLVILAVLYLGYRTMRSDVTAGPTSESATPASGGAVATVTDAAAPEPAPTLASATTVPEKLPSIDEIPAPVAPVAAIETAPMPNPATGTAALPAAVPPLAEIPPVTTAPAFPIPSAPGMAVGSDSAMAPPPPPAAMLPGIPTVPGLPPSPPADPTVASVPTVPGLPPSPPADPATPGMPAVSGLPPSPPADPAPPIAMLPPSPPPPATLPGMAPTTGVPDPTMPVPPSAITTAPVATLPGMEPPVPVAPPPATLPIAGTLPSTPMPAEPAVPGLPSSPPAVPSVPGLPPSPSTEVPPGLPPSVPGATKTNLVLTKAVEVQLTYGKISLRPGTQVRLISRQGQTAKVSYGGNIINVPVSSTDLE